MKVGLFLLVCLTLARKLNNDLLFIKILQPNFCKAAVSASVINLYYPTSRLKTQAKSLKNLIEYPDLHMVDALR